MLAARGKNIAYGDTAIAYVGYNDLRPFVVTARKELQCTLGRFPHENMVGKPYGSRIEGKANEKTATKTPTLIVLQLTPELWTQAVTHRTQIIYATDIAVICTNLRLRPGSVVAEAGTGSGSLTHSLARAVAPNGTVHTFDFHKSRALDARQEFINNGLTNVIRSHWADVCTTGPDVVATNNNDQAALDALEPVPDRIDNMTESQVGYRLPKGSVEALFLDVPSPWLAIDNVLHVVCPGGMICSFSPCIEQSQKLCEALRNTCEFVDIRTVEALSHDHVPVFKLLGQKRAREPKGDRGRADDSGDEGVSGTGSPVPEDDGETAMEEVSARGSRIPLQFRSVHMMKSHTAFLTFARRRVHPDPEELPKQ